jgi:hypothetical protein
MTANAVAASSKVGHRSVDRFGALASTACAVHCVLSASLPEALAALGLSALLGDDTEWAFTLCALAAASGALLLGWRKHRSPRVVSTLGAGIALLLLARLLEDWVGESVGTVLSVLAGVVLVVGHLSNIGASRRSECAYETPASSAEPSDATKLRLMT